MSTHVATRHMAHMVTNPALSAERIDDFDGGGSSANVQDADVDENEGGDMDVGIPNWAYVAKRYKCATMCGVRMKGAAVFTDPKYKDFRNECLDFAQSMPGDYGAKLTGALSWGVLVAALVVASVLTFLCDYPSYPDAHQDDTSVKVFYILILISGLQFLVSLMAGVQLLQVLPWNKEYLLPCHVLSPGLGRMFFHTGLGIVIGIILFMAAVVTTFWWQEADFILPAACSLTALYMIAWARDANKANGELFFFAKNRQLEAFFFDNFLDDHGELKPQRMWPVLPSSVITG